MAQVFCLGEALIDRLLPGAMIPAAIVWVVRRPMGPVPWRGWEPLLALLDAWGATPSVQPLQNSLRSEAWIPAVCSGMSSARAGWCWWSVMPAVIAVLAALMATAGRLCRYGLGRRSAASWAGKRLAGLRHHSLGHTHFSVGVGAGHQPASRWRGRLVLDVNWRPTFWGLAADAEPTAAIQQQMQPLLRQADLLKLAAEEAEGLFSSRDPQAVAAALPQRPAVVVTDGSKGVSWSMGAASGSLPAYRVPVVDTTGAGDAFLAGLLHRLVKEPNLLAGSDSGRVKQALQFASACGALVCQGAGAIDPQPAEAAVLAFMEQQSAG